jgi:ABC-type transporter Mla subunit MlaD
MPTSMDTTNTWLAVMTIAIVVQTLLMIGIAVGAWQAAQKASQALRDFEARHVTPLGDKVAEVSARVTAVADDVQEVMARVRRADDAVRARLGQIDNAAHLAGHAISAKVWPVVGLSRAVGAAVRAFTSRTSTTRSSPGTPHVAGVPTR